MKISIGTAVGLIALVHLSHAAGLHAQNSVEVQSLPIQPIAPLPAGDNLIFGWRLLPAIADASTGKLNPAVVFVSRANGTPYANLQLQIAIGSAPDSLTDPSIENAMLTTDANGLATFTNTHIKGVPRAVFLAVRTLDGTQSSKPVVLNVGPILADKIALLQRPAEVAENGGPLGAPKVLVTLRGVPLKDAVVTAITTSGSASLRKNVARTNADGEASFESLRITGNCSGQTCGSIGLQFIAGSAKTDVVTVQLQVPAVSRLIPLAGAPTETASGSLVPVFSIRAVSADDLSVPGVPVTVRSAGGRKLAEGITGADGLAMFDTVRVYGLIGGSNLIVAGGSVQRIMPMTIRTGSPSRIEIIAQPPARVAFDSVLSRSPRVLVTDASGNPVAGVAVKASVCVRALTSVDSAKRFLRDETLRLARNKAQPSGAEFDCDNLNLYRASLGGTTIRETGTDGRVEFSDLKFRGVTSVVQLRFEILGVAFSATASSPFTYDPRSDYDNNYVAINAIKTISGVAPESEFFDLRFRFRAPLRMHVMANIDVALTARSNADSASSPQKRLTEASLLINSPPRWTDRPESDVPERLLSAGVQLKVFGTVPYYGIHAVSMEMGGSPFQGSSLSVAYLTKWYGDSVVVLSGDTIPLAKRNLGLDFLIRSASVDFFKVITIRGSVMVPLDRKVKIATRIALAVPIGDVIRF